MKNYSNIIRKSGKLRIGTRRSRLAVKQAELFCARLCQILSLSPEDIDYVPVVTHGDTIKDKPLSEIGSVGVFVKELEVALRDGRIDIAVHSLKDMPTVLPDDMTIPCVMPRDDPRDTLICKNAQTLATLPNGSRVGTSSARREAQLYWHNKKLQVESLRGNIDTRIKAVDSCAIDATILAQCGLDRLGIIDTTYMTTLDLDTVLPAPAQGIVAAEILSHDTDLATALARINNMQTWYCAQAERSCLAVFDGGCILPLAAYAQYDAEQKLHLRAQLFSHDGSKMYSASAKAHACEAVNIGKKVAQELMIKAGDDLSSIVQHSVR